MRDRITALGTSTFGSGRRSCLCWSNARGAAGAFSLALSGWVLPASSQTLQEKAEAAAIADGMSTLGGLALGAAEANPFGLVTIVAKIPLLAYVKTLPQEEQAEWHATYGAMWGGAAANNLCILGAILTAGAFAPICPIVGLAWGMSEWKASAMERELWEICRQERAYWKNPKMTCDFFNKRPIENPRAVARFAVQP